MALYFQHENAAYRLAIWRIEEAEADLRAMLKAPLSYDDALSGLHLPKRRMEFLAARVLLAHLLGQEAEIHYYANGRPYLTEGGYLSITHSAHFVGVIYSPHFPVAIDLEMRSPKLTRLSPRFMGEAERSQTHPHAPLLHWTAKETAFKLLTVENVDFRSHLHVQPFTPSVSGEFTLRSTHPQKSADLIIHYHCFPDFACTWSVEK